MNGATYRQELKYTLSDEATYRLLCDRLKTVMTRDAHSGRDGEYRVVSLYFDNDADKALQEKLDGVNHREKFRIRCYNRDPTLLLLERKEKHGRLCRKTACRITREEYNRILAGNLAFLREDNHRPPFSALYRACTFDRMRPKTVVSYYREAFVYAPGRVRITFDRDLRTGRSHTDLFAPTASLVPLMPAYQRVLEVKYDTVLPDVIRLLLQSGTPRLGAFSKYAACRRFD